jgi:hypothetical protein
LDIGKRIARHQCIRVQMNKAICLEDEIAGPACGLGGALYQLAAGPNVLDPRNNVAADGQINCRLKTGQPVAVDQIASKPTKSQRQLIVVKATTCDPAEPRIMRARSVAVAMLEAETHGSACNQRHEVGVGNPGGRKDSRQNVQRGKACRIAHQGHSHEILDGAIAKQ